MRRTLHMGVLLALLIVKVPIFCKNRFFVVFIAIPPFLVSYFLGSSPCLVQSADEISPVAFIVFTAFFVMLGFPLFSSCVNSGLWQWCHPLLLFIDARMCGVLQGVGEKVQNGKTTRLDPSDIGALGMGEVRRDQTMRGRTCRRVLYIVVMVVETG
jgi:hypothetical protein